MNPIDKGSCSNEAKWTKGQFSTVGCRVSAATVVKAKAGLAQLVEHLICNQGVTGSSPVTGTSLQSKIIQDNPILQRF